MIYETTLLNVTVGIFTNMKRFRGKNLLLEVIKPPEKALATAKFL